jgi:hypothetical protein
MRKSIPYEEAGARWDHDIPSRLAALYLDEREPDERWSHQGLSGFAFTRCVAGCIPLPDLPEMNRTDVDFDEAVNIGFRDIDGFAENDLHAVGR